MDTNFVAFSILIALTICLTDVSCRERCMGVHNYCSGQFGDMKAICKDGYCYCTGQGYDYNTCLPDAYGCKIAVNADTALAKPRYKNQQRQTIYSCTPDSSSTHYEVHVLSVYEGSSHTRPPTAGDTHVNIVGNSNRAIILVLGSYEPVNWILDVSAGITISKVILVAYYIKESSVSGDTNQVQAVERKTYQWGVGFGSDIGGGNTVALLKQVYNRFGVVTSFTGTYYADKWSLVLTSAHGASSTPTATTKPTPTPTPTPKVHRQRCYTFKSRSYCVGSYKTNAVCRDGYCVCPGQDYDYITCLPDVYGCKIGLNADTALGKPLYKNQQPQNIYSCTPGNSSTQYEVHVLSVYQGRSHTRPPTAGDTSVNIVSRGKSNRPIILVLGTYEPVNWILKLPAGITISKVILVAYYINESSVSGDVNQVQAVEREGVIRGSRYVFGYGPDKGGGDTVGPLKQLYNRFGTVTSFTGTYKADEWTLVLSSSHGQSNPSCQNCTCLSEAVQKLTKMVEQLKEQIDSQHKRITELEMAKNRTTADSFRNWHRPW